MNWLSQTVRSSIGGKLLVAITGLMLVGFLIAHLLGNLLIFGGRDAINSYAKGLKDLGPLLWIARAGIVVFFVAHIYFTIRLSIENKRRASMNMRRKQLFRRPQLLGL